MSFKGTKTFKIEGDNQPYSLNIENGSNNNQIILKRNADSPDIGRYPRLDSIFNQELNLIVVKINNIHQIIFCGEIEELIIYGYLLEKSVISKNGSQIVFSIDENPIVGGGIITAPRPTDPD